MGTPGQTFNEETSNLGGPDRALMEEVQLNQTFMRGHCPKERMPEMYNLRMLLPRFSKTLQLHMILQDTPTRRQDPSIENVMDELTRFSDKEMPDAANKSRRRKKTEETWFRRMIVFANFLP